MEDDLKVIVDLLARAQRALQGYRQRLLQGRDTEAPTGDTLPVPDLIKTKGGDTPPVTRDTEEPKGDTPRDTPSILDQPIWPKPQPPTEDSP